MEVVTDDVLLLVFGSFCVALTDAVLVIAVELLVATSKVTVALAPLLILENWQVTVPDVCEQVPAVLETDAKEMPVGNGSVSTTLVAVLGPLLLTTIVYVKVSP